MKKMVNTIILMPKSIFSRNAEFGMKHQHKKGARAKGAFAENQNNGGRRGLMPPK